MYPDVDFFDALVMLHTNPLTGEYLGVIAFGCGIKEFIYTGTGMLADVDRAAECFPHCVVDGAVSEAVQALYDDVYADELYMNEEAS